MENSWPKMLVESIDDLFGNYIDSERKNTRNHCSLQKAINSGEDITDNVIVKAEYEESDDSENLKLDDIVDNNPKHLIVKTSGAVYELSYHNQEEHCQKDQKDMTIISDIPQSPVKKRPCGQCGNQHPTLGCSMRKKETKTPTDRCKNVSKINSHTNKAKEQMYKCKNCGEQFSTPESFATHRQSHSQMPENCKTCGKTYFTRPALAAHLLTHTKPHKCNVCDKSFSNQWLLRNHIRTHTGEKPYQCNQCERAFADQSNLRVHLRSHSGVKNFTCGECEKQFSTRQNLHSHLKSHTVHVPKTNRKKNFMCDICKKSFANRYNLKVHLRTHSGERPYECKKCQKSYGDHSTLRRHLLRFHSMKNEFVCWNCKEVFASKLELEKHDEFPCVRKEFSKNTSDVDHVSHIDERDSFKQYDNGVSLQGSVTYSEGGVAIKIENELIIESCD